MIVEKIKGFFKDIFGEPSLNQEIGVLSKQSFDDLVKIYLNDIDIDLDEIARYCQYRDRSICNHTPKNTLCDVRYCPILKYTLRKIKENGNIHNTL